MTKKQEWEEENHIKEEDFESDIKEAKAQKDSEEEIEEVVEIKKTKARYRYFCDACTNIAFFSDKIEEGLSGTCAVCGKSYVTRKENYILV